MGYVPMNRTRALIITPEGLWEAAKHLLAQWDVTDEEKQLANKALDMQRTVIRAKFKVKLVGE